MKPQTLYHGSPKDIVGEVIPNRPNDPVTTHPDDNLCAVYASNDRAKAILRAIIKKNGFPSQWEELVGTPATIYLYHLPSDTFEKTSSDSSQYISRVSVTPIKKEKIAVTYNFHSLEEVVKN